MSLLRRAGPLLALLWGLGCLGAGGPEPLVVASAGSLKPAFEELGERFHAATGVPVVLHFAASGVLAQQIAEGAPADVFASASRRYVQELEALGRLEPGTRAVYALGRLALWARADAPFPLRGLRDLLDPRVRRVALPNPRLAPYGVAAREALRRAGLWEALRPKLVMGEDVRQAFQYAATGNADAALVSLSLALSEPGKRALVPEDLYPPILHEMAVVAGTPRREEARAFVRFVLGPEGRAVLARHGFGLPEE